MKVLNWLTIVIFCTAPMLVFAQPTGNKKEQREARRIAFYTEKLDLNRTEAESFWPVYREMDKAMASLRKDAKAKRRGNIAEMNDKELEQLLDDLIAFKQKELDLKRKYHDEFKKILPIRKVAKLYHAEEQFKKRMQATKNKPSGSSPRNRELAPQK
jgi:hypothetical protein